MHYEDKKTGFKFDAVSGVPKENTVEAFEELFSANKAAEEGELPALPEPYGLLEFESDTPGGVRTVAGYCADDMQAYARQAIAADRASRQGSSVPDCLANKAAEEVDLDSIAKEALRDLSHIENYLQESDAPATVKNRAVDVRLCVKELREGVKAIAADRISRQVANKAEVEDCPECKGKGERRISCIWPSHCPDCDGTGKVATPPATTGASTGPRPTDDDLWDATLRDRDAYHEWADKLADAIAKHFGVDIGEHSNQNLPWDEALQAIENAEPVGASTVLTDERIEKIWQQQLLDAPGGKLHIYFGREVAREVAAQAGQVAVPEDVLRVVRRLLDGSQPQDVPGALMVIDTALAGGAA